jgi:hypothetical protein
MAKEKVIGQVEIVEHGRSSGVVIPGKGAVWLICDEFRNQELNMNSIKVDVVLKQFANPIILHRAQQDLPE